MTDELRCPWCGSSDVRRLSGAIWVCRDCSAEFTEDGEIAEAKARKIMKKTKQRRLER